MLERAGDARRYELDETYIAEEGAARFTENGEWRQRDDLIELTGEAGVARRYAVLPDGPLQPPDGAGRGSGGLLSSWPLHRRVCASPPPGPPGAPAGNAP